MNSHIIHVTHKDMADARNNDDAFPAAHAVAYAINRIAGLSTNAGCPDIGSSYVYFRKGSWDYYFRTPPNLSAWFDLWDDVSIIPEITFRLWETPNLEYVRTTGEVEDIQEPKRLRY